MEFWWSGVGPSGSRRKDRRFLLLLSLSPFVVGVGGGRVGVTETNFRPRIFLFFIPSDWKTG